MITQRQVDELHDGDVVELTSEKWPPGSVVRGPVKLGGYGYEVGPMLVTTGTDSLHLTVVSRAPRPLYVNHPRTEPVPGDVVRDAGPTVEPRSLWTWTWNGHRDAWSLNGQSSFYDVSAMPARLRLLVDGETGRCVP